MVNIGDFITSKDGKLKGKVVEIQSASGTTEFRLEGNTGWMYWDHEEFKSNEAANVKNILAQYEEN
jgi:hypothetical protein